MNVEKRMKICCLMLIDCILLTATCLLLSCSSLGRKKVCLPQLSFEISDKGLYEVNQTNRNGPKVISYFTPATLGFRWITSPNDGDIRFFASDNSSFFMIFNCMVDNEKNHGPMFKAISSFAEQLHIESSKTYLLKIYIHKTF